MTQLKYQAQIDEFFAVLREDWMSDEDFTNFKIELKKKMNLSEQEINDNLEKGVQDGYSVELQMNLAKFILTELKND